MDILEETANILNVNLLAIKKYMDVWGELYDLDITTPQELAGMIRDIIYYYE